MSAIGDKLRQILAASPRWAHAVKDLPLMAIAGREPIDLDACDADEAMLIAAWSVGRHEEMPARLAAYLEGVRS